MAMLVIALFFIILLTSPITIPAALGKLRKAYKTSRVRALAVILIALLGIFFIIYFIARYADIALI